MNKLKLQSAMEYLVTYSWAIIIILIVVGIIFYEFRFSSPAPTPNSCTVVPGYLCSSLAYIHSTGNVIVVLTQTAGSVLYNANVAFVPQGAPTDPLTGAPAILDAGSGNYNSIPTFTAQVKFALTLPATSPVVVGTPLSGTIWLSYTTTQAGTKAYYQRVATVTAKAE